LFTDEDFAVLDAQGRQFGRASATVLTDAEQQYKRDDSIDQVQPTFSARVVFVFDVATDAHGFTLVNVPLFSDTTQKLFRLGI
jgi:hypothetical protein